MSPKTPPPIEDQELAQVGQVLDTPISGEMKKAYLDYAMSVIVARALPDVKDGLKPVQRRIIYAAVEQNMMASDRYRKCATLVGAVMGKYHPHGDSSIYEALVRMGQPFSLRYPLIDGQGNFGSIDGDGAAAMRYTEARLTKIAEYVLQDIDQETVRFEDNFSGEHKEPMVLPSVIPNLLMNGAVGIAVGMATNIPPHNLGELLDGLMLILESGTTRLGESEERIIKAYDLVETKAIVQKWEMENTVELKELAKVIKGPDFPTGCTIYDQTETLNYFATGRGKIIQQGEADIVEGKGGKFSIVITEIPYQVRKDLLIEKIADLVNLKTIKDISDIRDESAKGNIRIVVELKRDATPQKTLNSLYRYTQLQTAFNVNMIALVDGEPQIMGMKAVLNEFIKHRRDIITNRTLYLLRKAREREHILEGLKKALDAIDEVIAIIKKSKDQEDAKAKLCSRFDLTDIQAQAILDMQLKRLAALEREKIEEELKQIQNNIAEYLKVLGDPKHMISVMKAEFTTIREKFADARKTKVVKGKIGELSEEDIIVNEEALISITESGYIKRMKPSVYKTQIRGGKGVIGMKTKDEDDVSMLRLANTHDRIFFFTLGGKVLEKRVWDIPEGARTGKGTPIVNLLEMPSSEKIVEVLSITKEDEEQGNSNFILCATKLGNVKKTALAEYANTRKTGIIGMRMKDGDEIVRVRLTNGKNEVLLVTSLGKSIRFHEDDVRPMGRSASGIRGIRLKGGDTVVSMETLDGDGKEFVLNLTEHGFGKKTPVAEFPKQNRGGSGVIAAKVTDKTGKIAAVRIVDALAQDAIISSVSGQIIRVSVDSIKELDRPRQGVIVMKLSAGDSLSSVSILAKEVSEEKPETD